MWKSLMKKMNRVRQRKWPKMPFSEEKVSEAKANY
jgi:hypothetical protein